MPRVLHVVLSLQPGGAERLVIDLCQRLDGGFASAVCCLDEPGAWASQLPPEVEVVALGRRPGFRPSLARTIASVAGRVGASLVHCHQYSAFVYGTLAHAMTPSLPVVATEHGRLDEGRAGLKRRLANRLLNVMPVTTFAVSRHLREQLIREGFPARRVEVIHNGIEPGPPATAEARDRARLALGIGRDDAVVGAVGRLSAVKDFATLIDAFARLRRDEATRLVIVGDGAERESLMARARAAGLGAAVLMPGHRDDARQLMPAFDVFVNSSVYEGISLTVLEAMAAGLPIVATRVGGTPEVVDEETTGQLIPSKDASALAEAVQTLLADPTRRSAIGARARARIVESFDIRRMVERYARVYAGLGAA